MKDGDTVRSLDNRSIGKFVKVTEYTGYIDGGSWRTPECTIKDITQYWKVVPAIGGNKNRTPFD
ncbi:hypothetical protein [Neobacillus mesonae]|uniref:Uncharacterized protein n=1 Tax=Neobacillus mesonae TaxID=1193713 RepID=A0A3T0HV47_9BACI|nr:hypothetical protein [Neobacillus mesonae]AZU61022.1 hypothetical protein CHR53_07020 [Neobacillus mesonae]